MIPAPLPKGLRACALLAAGLLIAAGGAAARAAPCLRYEPDIVALEGVLRLRVFPGPPHYAAIESGDAPEAVWMLELTEPQCTADTGDDRAYAGQQGIRAVRIVPRTHLEATWSGRAALVEGSLSRARNAHQHADILLRASAVELRGPAGPGPR